MIGKLKDLNTSSQFDFNLKKALWYIIPIMLLVILVSILGYNYYSLFTWQNVKSGINFNFVIFFFIGIFAQLVDGTLGMGYGATSTSCLLAMGVPPAISSTAVHVSEMFTTGASAIAHHKFGNINKKLTKSLIIPGVLGSILGAYLLSDVINGDAIKPFIAMYMICLATIIIIKALRKNIIKKKAKRLGILATFGGFMDAIGGGGWGPIVTSTLLGSGRHAKYTIGSVNAAEFAVSFASGATFLLFGGIVGWQIIIALILGGILAAPIAAILVNKIKRKPMMIAVGILIIILSTKTLYKFL
ncbi:MAG: sulfite exporter TauE/SafE family protein [Ferruginibacter sp.]|nr:sulfite exporter TauE/SafE family protein [Ferruginibacter sp.]